MFLEVSPKRLEDSYSVRTRHLQTRTRLVLAKRGLDPSLLLAREKEVLTQVTQLTLSKFGLGVFGLTLYSPIFISEMESVWCVGFNRISYVSCMFREVYYTKTVFYLLTSWLRAASHPLTGLAPLGPLKKVSKISKKKYMLKRCRKRCRKRIPLRPWPYKGEVVFF